MDIGDDPERRALSDLVLDGASVADFLGELCVLAAGIVPQAHCGFTLDRDGHALTVASNDGVAAQLDTLERRYGDGPGREAVRTCACVEVADLRADGRWPQVADEALALGVGSGVWLPLVVRGEAIGVLTLTAPAPRAFTEAGVQRAQASADQAAAGLTLALTRSGELFDAGAPPSLRSRQLVDQALGMLMHARQISSAEAAEALLGLARAAQLAPEDMAARIVSDGTADPHRPTT